MAANLSFTTEVGQDGKWTITASILVGSDIPRDVFLYENTGTTTLGSYFGVADLGEYKRFQPWTGTAIPAFGNKYVRSATAVIQIPLTEDPNVIKAQMVATIKSFRTAFLAGYTHSEVIML